MTLSHFKNHGSYFTGLLAAILLAACSTAADRSVDATKTIRHGGENYCWDGSLVFDPAICPIKHDDTLCWDGVIYEHSYECPTQFSREYCWDGVTQIGPDNPDALCPPVPE